jgi:DNA-binding transcriptional ArsR family regulator
MDKRSTALIEDAERARMALSPLRRQLLAALREPGSAASLAARLNMPRQKLGYHLRALEAAGLVRLVEERKRRGFTERVLVADAMVLDPGLLTPPRDPIAAQDQYAAAHLVGIAGGIVREVTRMASAAEAEGRRLLTLTIEADVGFGASHEFEEFAARLAKAARELTMHYLPGEGRRGYRLVMGAHPAVAGTTDRPIN